MSGYRDGHLALLEDLEARPARRARDGAGASAGSLEAPMPGTVLLVHVANGDRVARGQPLVAVEAA